ncbi:synaptotagmin-4 isoform X2 [Notolabrus celidotus]|uniref:synaptotagmin-4 isoform X2 n=1 Tax=Notolabrus celidotus TaxID=1203425 RepID=UPI0014900743|nr:synaptotagmin-4 isoform X2 [Notolabrus celidotus]
MAPFVAEGDQLVAVPVGVAVMSVFGLVFTASAFAWICCQRKNTKSQMTPPYKFVHMLKGVDIYPESLSNKKKFAAAATATTNDSNKTDVRSSPDLELPSPHAGFTQPGMIDHHDLPSPSSTLSSQAPTPAVDKPQGEEKEGGLGTLHFSLEYQPEKKAFVVHIKEAHGLTPTDDQSLTSDPYIKLTLLPEKKHRVKTRVLRKTLDPAFDETFSFYGIPLARVSELALHFMVLSFDRFSRDEVIGETLVPLSGIDLSEGRVLMSREIIKKNVKKSRGRGELLLSLCYQSTTNTLTVVVLKARHLPKTQDNGPTDPYVKVNMYHGKKRVCKKKTHVKKCSPNPVFNELFVFDLPSDEGLMDTSVELLLMDSDTGSSRSPNTTIGRLVLGTSVVGIPGEHWREICDHPRRQIAKWHILSED